MKKLSLSLLLVIFAATIGLGWGLDRLYAHIQQSGNADADSLEAYQDMGIALAQSLDTNPTPQNAIANLEQYKRMQLTIIEHNELQLPSELLANFSASKPLVLESEQEYLLHFHLPKQQSVLLLTLEKEKAHGAPGYLPIIFTSLFYLGILLVIFIWLYPLIKHLKQLGITARQVGEGQLDRRIDIESTSYICDIEIEFNRMAQRIETLVKDNKLLGNAVSHDLRTPLARLRFGIEALQETSSESNKQKYMARMSRDIEEMESLVAVLLSYARIEQAMISVQQAPVALSELVESCVSQMGSSDKSFQLNLAPDTKLVGDLNYLRMLITNLVNNAQQYGNQCILISVYTQADRVILRVEDDGPGIAAEQRDELLKPFVRGDNQMNSGFGMGLAIAERIALWHQAKLRIGCSKQLAGASVSVVFKTNSP